MHNPFFFKTTTKKNSRFQEGRDKNEREKGRRPWDKQRSSLGQVMPVSIARLALMLQHSLAYQLHGTLPLHRSRIACSLGVDETNSVLPGEGLSSWIRRAGCWSTWLHWEYIE
jgi:hypothetical protein